MPTRRSKKKDPGDYKLVAILRNGDQYPLHTTFDGLNAALIADNVPAHQREDFISAVKQGGIYEPKKGPFRRIHLIRPSVEDRLREIAVTIKHSGKFGTLWWHRKKRTVLWSHADEDTDELHVAGGTYTALDAVRRMFLTIIEVRQVETVCEAVPDFRRDREWVEIYPMY